MRRYLTHITKAGDRWDLLAHRYYDDVNQMVMIMECNPHLALSEVLESGVTVYIPLLPAPAVNAAAGLPPWRRA